MTSPSPTGTDLITNEMLDKGEYVLSEWLNDNAPIGQARYREPAKAAFKEMYALLAPTPPAAAQGLSREAAAQKLADIWDSFGSGPVDPKTIWLAMVDAIQYPAPAAVTEVPLLETIFEWYRKLKPSVREKMAVVDLHDLSKALLAEFRIEEK